MKYILLVMLAVLLSGYAFAQETDKDFLKGLKLAGENDIDQSKGLMVDGETIPIYTEDGKRIRGAEMMKIMEAGEMVIDPYIDKDKNVKLFLLRLPNEDEKKHIMKRKINSDGADGSENIGKDITPFSVTDLNGKKFSTDELKGKTIVINFWFIGCPPCRNEIPELNKLVDKYSGKDVVFVAFAMDDASKLKTFLGTTEYKYNIIPASDEVIKAYNVSVFPTNIVVDKGSKISFYKVGFGPGSVEELDKAIEMGEK